MNFECNLIASKLHSKPMMATIKTDDNIENCAAYFLN